MSVLWREATDPDGIEIPGFANCHSHVFHRALRGRTHDDGGSFWTWRERMYALAEVLDPDLLHRLATAVYAEMAMAGITAVGEFHYLHHDPSGRAYADPNAMGEALIAAARTAGIRIALIDTCYLSAGFGRPVEGVQRRFSDGDADRWADRVDALRAKHAGDPDVVIGAGIHSVRAVPADQLATVADWARSHDAPLHVHLSEQPAENEECLARHGSTPTSLLDASGVWGPATTAVHATHLSTDDIETLGGHGVFACFCPTTERDLADGIGPSRRLHDAGARLTLGSDSNAVIDMFEEMRAVELDERLASLRRGTWPATELLTAATRTGQESLGFSGHGSLDLVGSAGDSVTVGFDSVRLAGATPDPASAVFAATTADVRDVSVDGDLLVSSGWYDRGDVAAQLRTAIEACWQRVDGSPA